MSHLQYIDIWQESFLHQLWNTHTVFFFIRLNSTFRLTLWFIRISCRGCAMILEGQKSFCVFCGLSQLLKCISCDQALAGKCLYCVHCGTAQGSRTKSGISNISSPSSSNLMSPSSPRSPVMVHFYNFYGLFFSIHNISLF